MGDTAYLESGIYFDRFRRWLHEMPNVPLQHRRAFLFSIFGVSVLWRAWPYGDVLIPPDTHATSRPVCPPV